MCGIAGVAVARPTSPVELAARVRAMCAQIRHRGPDEEGQFVTPRVALGSQRLRVIDLLTGRMPIGNEDGRIQVVYNGEIYNYRTLRDELRDQGHVFRTAADTEVLVHLYERDGIELLRHLRGMFAFALWDADRERLVLARDRLGIKPLFYRCENGTLTFGSELKSLLAVADSVPSIDPEALAEYLALGYIRAPRTIYRGYHKVLPGTVLTFTAGEVQTERYWTLPERPQLLSGSAEDALEELDEHVQRAVSERLVADVPLGAFLSGGVDSSLVTAVAAQHATGRLKTFSVGFPGDDELPFARHVARRYDTDHHELVLGPDDCRIAPDLLSFFDEPFGDASAIPTYYVSQLARRDVTVTLSGDGGDELFGGYSQYQHDAQWAWLDAIPTPLRQAAFGWPAALLAPGARGRNRLRVLAAARADRFTLYRAQELNPATGGIMAADVWSTLARHGGWFDEEFRLARHLPFPARLLYVDTVTYLPDDILAKVDRMSMAHSLEARVPLLDHLLVEFAARVPAQWKLRHGQTKWLLKRLAERYVPAEVLHRPKRGFSLPIGSWLRGPLLPLLDALVAPDAASRSYLHAPTVRRLVAEHRTARRDHADMLWRLAMLESWLQRGGDGLSDLPPSQSHGQPPRAAALVR